MVASASSAGEFAGAASFGRFDATSGLPAGPTAPEAVTAGYYLLSPEVRQRLAGGAADSGNEILRTYEAAALLHSAASWNFPGFPSVSPSYAVSQLPYLQQTTPGSRQTIHPTREMRDERRLSSERTLENGPVISTATSGRENESVFAGAENTYEMTNYSRDKLVEEESLSSSSSTSRMSLYRNAIVATTCSPPTSPTSPNSLVSKSSYRHLSPISSLVVEVERTRLPSSREDPTATVVLTATSAEKRVKKPFTIENIIAPDDNNEGSGDGDGGSAGGGGGGAGSGGAGAGVGGAGAGGAINVADDETSRLPHESIVKKSSLLVPRPLYAGYSMSIATTGVQRPSYGTAT